MNEVEEKLKEHINIISILDRKIFEEEAEIDTLQRCVENQNNPRKKERRIENDALCRKLETEKETLRKLEKFNERFSKVVTNIVFVTSLVAACAFGYAVAINAGALFGITTAGFNHFIPFIVSDVVFTLSFFGGAAGSSKIDDKIKQAEAKTNFFEKQIENSLVNDEDELAQSVMEVIEDKKSKNVQNRIELAEAEEQVWQILRETKPEDDTEYMSQIRSAFYPTVFIPEGNPAYLKYFKREDRN